MRTLFTLALALTLAASASAQEEASGNPVVVIKTSMGTIEAELFEKDCPKTVENFLGLAMGTKSYKDPSTGEQTKGNYYDGLIFHRVIKGFMIQGGCPLGTGAGNPGFQFEDEIDAKALGLDKLQAFEGERMAPHPWLLIRSREQLQRQIVMPLVQKLGITSQEQMQQRQAEVMAALKKMTLMDAYQNMGYRYRVGASGHKPVKGVLAMANAGPNTNGSQFFINLADTPHLTGKHTVFGKVVKGMDIVEKIGEAPVGAGSRPATDIKILSIRKK